MMINIIIFIYHIVLADFTNYCAVVFANFVICIIFFHLFFQELSEVREEYEERLSQKESESMARVSELTVEANRQNEENQQQVETCI